MAAQSSASASTSSSSASMEEEAQPPSPPPPPPRWLHSFLIQLNASFGGVCQGDSDHSHLRRVGSTKTFICLDCHALAFSCKPLLANCRRARHEIVQVLESSQKRGVLPHPAGLDSSDVATYSTVGVCVQRLSPLQGFASSCTNECKQCGRGFHGQEQGQGTHPADYCCLLCKAQHLYGF